MPGATPSEKELAVLRSFARRIDPSDAGAHNNLGVLYYRKGLAQDAIAQFRRALELDPRTQVAQANLDLALRESGHFDRRLRQLEAALAADPGDRAARWELGGVLAALGRHDAAVAAFEQLLARAPADVAVLLQLGIVEKARGRLDAAGSWFERAVLADPESAVPRFLLGESLYNRGLNEPARDALRAAIARNADYAEAHWLLSFVCGDMGDAVDADAHRRRALALNPALGRAQANLLLPGADGAPRAHQAAAAPKAVPAHVTLGLALRQKGYFEDALREYRRALDAGEDPRLVEQAIAEVHLLRRDLAAARAQYERLVERHPEAPKLWNELGVCLHHLGERGRARGAYARACALDAAYAQAWNNLGVLAAQTGDLEGAAEALGRAVDAAPALLPARLNLALLRLQRGRLPDALRAYQDVLELAPAQAEAWNGVGLALKELRRFAEARDAFGRAIDAAPELAAAHYNLSFVLSELGDYEGALRATRRALELEPYYVPQKFRLTIELQYEEPDLAMAPELSADVPVGQLKEGFTYDDASVERLFEELGGRADQPPAAADPLALARDYLGKGLLDLAAAEAARAVARGADPLDVALVEAQVHARRGLHGEALERFQRVREARPAEQAAVLGEVAALVELGRTAEARELSVRLEHEAGGDPERLLARARAQLADGDAAGALAALTRVQSLWEPRADVLHLVALANWRLGRRDAARDAFRMALELDLSAARVWFDLGRFQEAGGELGGAGTAYGRALDLLPTYLEASLALAALCRRQGDHARARHVLADAVALDPYAPDGLVALGQTLLAEQRGDEALVVAERALRLDPGRVPALVVAADALELLGRYDEAAGRWERVAAVAPGVGVAGEAKRRARQAREAMTVVAASPDARE